MSQHNQHSNSVSGQKDYNHNQTFNVKGLYTYMQQPPLLQHDNSYVPHVQSKHRRLYTTSALSPHTLSYTNTHTLTQHKRLNQFNYYRQSGGPSWCTHPSTLCLAFTDAAANWSCWPCFLYILCSSPTILCSGV